MTYALPVLLSLLLACGCHTPQPETGFSPPPVETADTAPSTVTASGVVYQFRSHEPLPGATVTTLQFPDVVAVTDDQGAYTLEGIPYGGEFTPWIQAPEHRQAAHRTFVADGDITQLYVQLVPLDLFNLLATGLTNSGIPVDLDGACHVVTTVSVPEAGQLQTWDEFLAFGDAGLLPHATATLTPGEEATQLYFNEEVLPDGTLQETTTDGGVLWLNLQPGRKELTASHPDHDFPTLVVDCEPGRFINASPPYGLTAL